jgi:RHS repeat-associated protein
VRLEVPANLVGLEGRSLKGMAFTLYNGRATWDRTGKASGGNVAPTVSLTAPSAGASFNAPASITLTANATDSDGSIAYVEFYEGTTLLGTASGAPYSYTWSNVAAGSYSLTAKAFDNQGASTASAPVAVSVNASVAHGVYYIYADHLNTPRVITDNANKVVWRWDSDPFGSDAANEDPDGDGVGFGYNLRFPGQYFDRETNLHYNYFRDYDPSTGRYVQSDPIGLDGGQFSTYAYVRGDPLSYVDPLGLDVEVIVWGPDGSFHGSWGHVSSDIGGVNNSFGQKGWDKTYPGADEYIKRQQTRRKSGGKGYKFKTTPEQDGRIMRCIRNTTSYDSLTQNCGRTVQYCLNQEGMWPDDWFVFPKDIQESLDNNPNVSGITNYPYTGNK